jgi:hypothetical protein
MSRARAIAAALAGLIATAAAVWAAVLVVSGGLPAFTIAGVRVSSNDPWRPLAAAVLAAALMVWIAGPRGAYNLIRRALAAWTPARIACLLALATTAIGLTFNSWTASGPDSYAYVSQAALWRSGTLRLPVPLAARAPWPDAIATFATPGYRPAPDGSPALVPVTAPGLPLAMAAAQTIAGHAAAFVLTPIAGGLLVLLTFLTGRRVHSSRVGLVAAWLVATSPAALYMLMWPMTDIPAAAATALMIWGLLGTSTGAGAAAGLAAAAGLMIRPNFVLIAAAGWIWLSVDVARAPGGPGRWRRLAAFTIAAAPGEAIVMLVNLTSYGAIFASGYGAVDNLLSWRHVRTNLGRYVGWLAGSSPIGLAGLATLAVPRSRLWPTPAARRAGWLLLATTAAAWSVYLAYTEFVDWWYLRFLLPAWPALFIAAALLAESGFRRGAWIRRATAVAIALCGVAGVMTARDRGIFNLGRTERRYATIAHLVGVYTEPDAVILTAQHSGTLRYYAGRDTLRFDFLDPAWLDRALGWLAAEGRHPYVLIEDWEQPGFEARFKANSNLAGLPMPPVFVWHSKYTPGEVRLYDPLRRDGSTADPGLRLEDAMPRVARPAAAGRTRRD